MASDEARIRLRTFLLVLLLAACVSNAGRAQSPPDGQEQEKEKSTGLPKRIDWTFNFDAGWSTFGFGNALFNNPREGVEESLSDNWSEGFVKPALSGVFRLPS